MIDTNVVVSGVLSGDPDSPTAWILDSMLKGVFPFLLSTPLMAEYRQVLLRPRIRRLHGLTEEEVDALLTEIIVNGIMREPEIRTKAPDPGDNHLCTPGLVSETAEWDAETTIKLESMRIRLRHPLAKS